MPSFSIELLFGLCALIAGVVLWIHEVRRFREKRNWLKRASMTDGAVSRINEGEDYNPRDELAVTYKYEVKVVKYRAANGFEYEFNADTAVGGIGTPVKVAYDPDLPSSARVFQEPVFQIGCAAAVLAVGVILIFLGFRS